MSKRNGLYFSMQRWNETQDQWLRRTAPAYEHRNQSRGLSGKPNKQGIRRDMSFTHEIDGIKYEVVRLGYGWRASCSVETWAKWNGFDFVRENGNGCTGMCERLDGIVFKGPKYFSRFEVYNNDSH